MGASTVLALFANFFDGCLTEVIGCAMQRDGSLREPASNSVKVECPHTNCWPWHTCGWAMRIVSCAVNFQRGGGGVTD